MCVKGVQGEEGERERDAEDVLSGERESNAVVAAVGLAPRFKLRPEPKGRALEVGISFLLRSSFALMISMLPLRGGKEKRGRATRFPFRSILQLALSPPIDAP